MLQSFNPVPGTAQIAVPGRLTISAVDGGARASLRLDPPQREMASLAFGVALPDRMGAIATAGGRRAVCLGPDDWLLLAAADEMSALAEASRALAPGVPHSFADISDRDCAIDIHGAAAAYALMAGCPLDLDAMVAGTATRTLFDRADVTLLKEAPDHYRLTCLRSWTPYVWSLLAVIGEEIAADL